MSAEKSGLAFPFIALLKKLSGVEVLKKPRQPAPWQPFQQACYTDLLQPKVDKAMVNRPSSQRGGVLMRVTQEEFKMLSHVEQTYWRNEAERIGNELKKAWQEAVARNPSLTPADIQS